MSETAQNVAWKRELRRSLKREQIAREQAALHAVRRRIAELRIERVAQKRRLRATARATRRRVRQLGRSRRDELRRSIAELAAQLRAARAERRALAGRVRLALQLVRRLTRRRAAREGAAYAAARADLERLRQEHAEALRLLRDLGGRLKGLRSTRAERRGESDDEVRSNLDPELVEVFDAVRGQIKDRAGRSRTEAFLEWVEAHPDDVWLIKQRRADRELRQLVKAQHHRGRKLIAAAADIPF